MPGSDPSRDTFIVEQDIPATASYNFQFRIYVFILFSTSWRHPVDDLPDKLAKSDKPEKNAKPKKSKETSGVTRRDFLKISGVTAAVPLVSHVGALALAEEQAGIQGPGKVPVSLNVNGKKLSTQLE